MKVGRRIKQLRHERNLSQVQLSYASNLDRSYIADVESGNRNISIVNIEKIASAMDVSMREFYNTDYFDDHSASNEEL